MKYKNILLKTIATTAFLITPVVSLVSCSKASEPEIKETIKINFALANATLIQGSTTIEIEKGTYFKNIDKPIFVSPYGTKWDEKWYSDEKFTKAIDPNYKLEDSITCYVKFDEVKVDTLNIVNGVLYGFDERSSFEQRKEQFDSTLVIPNTVKEIANNAFWKNNDSTLSFIENLVFEDGSCCKLIGENAFRNAPIKQLLLPPSLNKLGKFSFASTQIKYLYFPDGKRDTNGNYCDDIEKYHNENGISYFDDKCFFNCKQLEAISLGLGKNQYYGKDVFALEDDLGNICSSNIRSIDMSRIIGNYCCQLSDIDKYEAQASNYEKLKSAGYWTLPPSKTSSNKNMFKVTKSFYVAIPDVFLAVDNLSKQKEEYNKIMKSLFPNLSQTKTYDLCACISYDDGIIYSSRSRADYYNKELDQIITDKSKTTLCAHCVEWYINGEDSIKINKEKIAVSQLLLNPYVAGYNASTKTTIPFDDDIYYEVINPIWTNGTDVQFSIEKYVAPTSTYRNNQFQISWDEDPSVGSCVEFTLRIYQPAKFMVHDLSCKLTFTQ